MGRAKPETYRTRAILTYLKQIGGDGFHVHGSSMQRKGEPDISGEVPDVNGRWHHLKLEVKTPTGQPTKLQLLRLSRYSRRGYVTGVVTSITDVQRILKQHAIVTPIVAPPKIRQPESLRRTNKSRLLLAGCWLWSW